MTGDTAYEQSWEEHSCMCAVVSAPCSHCTDCPVCNCQKCDEHHFTNEGETCPYLIWEDPMSYVYI